MIELGRVAKSPRTVFLTGGASALLFDWRETTIDVDLKFDPEPSGVFSAIPSLKDKLRVNVELAAPDDFVPALPERKKRCIKICTHNDVDFYHFDFYTQALSKLERRHAKDLLDVEQMVAHGLVEKPLLATLFASLSKDDFARYPSIEYRQLAEEVSELSQSL